MLYTIEVLIFKAFIDSNIGHDEFVSVNNVLKEYDGMKEEIRNSNKILRNSNMFDVVKEILISEKKFTETNYERLRKKLWFT